MPKNVREFRLLGGGLNWMVFKDTSDSKFYQRFSLLSLRLWLNLGSRKQSPRPFSGKSVRGKRRCNARKREKHIQGMLEYPTGYNLARNPVRARTGGVSSRQAGQKHHASLRSDAEQEEGGTLCWLLPIPWFLLTKVFLMDVDSATLLLWAVLPGPWAHLPETPVRFFSWI